ncbi:uncharacterized protein [Anoplolepis gracilipes]|uniref:uncharacterized protein n=1 Tax=Anoplolepis gracilipes TaxID=354296 RepID=UPI003BA1BA94
MVKFVTYSSFGIFHRPKRRTSKDYSNSQIFTTAKFDKLDSYTSKALKLRVNPEIDFSDKNTKKSLTIRSEAPKVRRNTDLPKSKLKITASEYWKNVLHNQWLLVFQGIVIIIVILTMGIWMRRDCKEDIVDDSFVTAWHSIIEQLQEIIIEIGTELRPCYNTEADTQKRRTSILKRKRIFLNE